MKEELKPATWKGAAVVLVLWIALFLYCIGEAIFNDHTSHVTQEANLGAELASAKKQAEGKLSSETNILLSQTKRLQSTITDLERQCAVKEGINETLQNQNRDQQNTVNGCLSQAMKLLTPEAFKMTVLFLDNEFQSTDLRRVRWLLLANKTVTPVLLQVSCDRNIEEINSSIVGSGIKGGGEDRLAPQMYNITLATPAWSPASP